MAQHISLALVIMGAILIKKTSFQGEEERNEDK
jgi:hypothetical protein